MDAEAILSRSTIPNPCPMDWASMSGGDQVRYCSGCGKHVYNLTAMSPDETVSLISAIHERVQNGAFVSTSGLTGRSSLRDVGRRRKARQDPGSLPSAF